MLRVWLCGRFVVQLDGQDRPVPTSDRARALIGVLALHVGPNQRSDVAARLWPDVPDESARASLRTAIWAVRRSLGDTADSVLVTTRSTLGLDPASTWVDANDIASIEEHRGDLLPGLDDDWVRAARDTRRRQVLQRLEDLANDAELDGRVDDAVRWSRDRSELAPLDESAHRELVRRLALTDARAEAVVVARAFSERLKGELGIRPSPATRAAHAQIQSPTPAGSRTALYGRSGEIATLLAAWRTSAKGHGQVVVVTGEGGIGKTSLIAELGHRVGTSGGRTAIGAGIDVGGETPFAAWLELVRSLVATVAPVPPGAAWPVELSRLSPDLGARLGRPDPPPTVAAPELERLRVFEAVLRLVEWSCSDRPVLIALDDAHRADRASLRLMAHIGRRIASLPILLVLTRRDRPTRPEVDALLTDLDRRGVTITEVDLSPVDESAVTAIARSISPLDETALRRVFAAAEGNPLLVVESARAVASGATSPPPNLRSGVRSVLRSLEPTARELAELLAAAGRPLTLDELDRLELSGLRDAEAIVTETGLLVRRTGGLGYRHALLREVAYADIADPAALHDALAIALDPVDRAEIAHHLTLAGRGTPAARQWEAAAAHAQSLGALSEAVDFLGRATQCAPNDAAPWLALAEVAAWRGRRDEMDAAWKMALERLDASDFPRAWCEQGRLLRGVLCHPTAARLAYEQAQSLMQENTPADVQAATLVGLAWSNCLTGDLDGVDGLIASARELLANDLDSDTSLDLDEITILGLIRRGLFHESAAIARIAGPRSVRARRPDRAYALLIHGACALACIEEFDAALELAEQAVRATEAVPAVLVECLAAQAHLLARLGRYEEAAVVVERRRACADRLDAPSQVAMAVYDAGLIALVSGNNVDASRLLAEALDLGAGVSRPIARLAAAEAAALAGDPDEASRRLRLATLEPVSRADQPWALVPRMSRVQALIAAARGDAPRATRLFTEAAAGWRRIMATTMPTASADGYVANLVDLGRPPVVGLVEPARELARIEREISSVAGGPTGR